MIIVRLMGGMGNQMFQYAVGRALALTYNTRLKLDLTFLLDHTSRPRVRLRDYDLPVFNIAAEPATREEVPFLYRKHLPGRMAFFVDGLRRRMRICRGSEKYFHFDPAVLEIGPDAYLDGYWQSPKYFDRVAETIRKEFALRDLASGTTQELAAEIASQESVCVHVRRGDFVNSSWHWTLGPDYYMAGLGLVTAKMSSPRVYVFSDDINWCRGNLRLPYQTTLVDHRYAGPKSSHHLALMSACRAFVIANSSFGWWTAWLNAYPEKIVVAPKRWFLDRSINTADLIPPGWITI